MQKALIIERSSSNCSEQLNEYLAEGWVVEKMTPFHPCCSVSAAGEGYTSQSKSDKGSILVVIENMGVNDV